MAKRKAPRPPDVIQARRFELVDDDGEVLAILGSLAIGERMHGLALYQEGQDGHVSERVSLSVADDGPTLAMSLGGNIALQAGVFDPCTEAVFPGPYVELMDREGVDVVGCRVDGHGTPHVTHPALESGSGGRRRWRGLLKR